MKISFLAAALFFLILVRSYNSYAAPVPMQLWGPCPQSDPGATCKAQGIKTLCGTVPSDDNWYYCTLIVNGYSGAKITYYSYNSATKQCSLHPIVYSVCDPANCPCPPPAPNLIQKKHK